MGKHLKKLFFVLSFNLSLTQLIWAQDAAQKLKDLHSAKPDQFYGLKSMNDIEFKAYKDFLNWNFVTVRYRQDSHEMRFTYANEVAWNALQAGIKDYPDGAVFAKMGYMTDEDPGFPSSLVPSGAKRYQFMIRDKKKYKETDGWGYALFNSEGLTFPGNPKDAAQACAACHRIVENRGYVFSQLMGRGQKGKLSINNQTTALLGSKVKFKKFLVKNINIETAKRLLSDFEHVSSVEGEIQKNIFEGTLDEIRPFLEKESESTGRPAILYNEEKKMISFVFKDKTRGPCLEDQIKWKYGVTISSPLVGTKTYFQNAEDILRTGYYCKKGY